MSLGASIVGIGRAMQQENDDRSRRKDDEDRFNREQERHARNQYVSMFEDVMKNPEKYPSSTYETAMKMYMSAVNPATKLKDIQGMHGELVSSTARNRALGVLGIKNQGQQMQVAGRQGSQVPTTGHQGAVSGPNPFIPALALSQAFQQTGQQMNEQPEKFATEFEQRTGPLRPDEVFEQQTLPVMESQAQMAEMLRRKYTSPEIKVGADNALYRINPDGTYEVLQKPQPTANAEYIFTHPNEFTPQQVKNAEQFIRWSKTTQGDPARISISLKTDGNGNPLPSGGSGGAASGTPNVNPKLLVGGEQKRFNGQLGMYYPRMQANGLSNFFVPYPQGMQDDLNSKEKDAKASLELKIKELNEVEQALLDPTNPASSKATGMWNSVVALARNYEIAGLAPNDPRVNQVRQSLTATLSSYLRDMSGAAISPAEARRLKDVVPNVLHGKGSVLDVLREFRSQLQFTLDRRYGPEGIGPSTGPLDTTDVLSGYKSSYGAGAGAGATNPTPVVPGRNQPPVAAASANNPGAKAGKGPGIDPDAWNQAMMLLLDPQAQQNAVDKNKNSRHKAGAPR